MWRNDQVDRLAEFKRGASGPRRERYLLRLYVSGLTPRSTRAVASLRALCEEHLAGRYDLEVIDIYQQPDFAEEAEVTAAPTLVKEWPPPVRRLIGSLSDERRVLARLDL